MSAGVEKEFPMYVCDEETGYALVNMTPHDLHFYVDSISEESDYMIPRCGIAPRMTSSKQHRVTVAGGIPIWTYQEFTGVDFTDFQSTVPGDPAKRGIIVSRFVAEFLKRSGAKWPGGVFSPDMGPDSAVRSAEGNLLGCKRLECWITPLY